MPDTRRSTASPIVIQIAYIVARIEAIDALYPLIEYLPISLPANVPTSLNLPTNLLPVSDDMGKRLHPTKVLAIRSMLLKIDDMYAISEALNVTYSAVSYHKRKMDRIELASGMNMSIPTGRMQRIGPEFVDLYTTSFII